MAHDGKQMTRLLKQLLSEPSFAEDLAINGLATIRLQHTCAHRVDELLAIYERLSKDSLPRIDAAEVDHDPRLSVANT
jgi:spore maturation protein CgeB